MDRTETESVELAVSAIRRSHAALAGLLLFAMSTTLMAAPAADAARVALVKAIASHDWKSVAGLTQFPLAIEMYQAAPALTKPQFLKDPRKLSMLFGDGDKDILACVATAPLAHQGDKKQFGFDSWFADCNGNEYYFGLRGGKWLFTAYQNINE